MTTEHKFKIGQMVHFQPKSRLTDAPTRTSYQITARLPPMDGEFQYRIRSGEDQHERIASEGELRLSSAQ